jgi:hypothetical protein
MGKHFGFPTSQFGFVASHWHMADRAFIFDGLLGFGLNLGPFVFLLYLVALAAGVLILIGK